MEINDFKEELLLLKKLATSKDRNGKPLIIRDEQSHTMKVNPNIEPAILVSLLNYLPKMCNPEDSCMSITTTELAEMAYMNNKEKEYNVFIRQVNALTEKATGLAMYKKAKESKQELTFPDFQYFFETFADKVDTDYISKNEKMKYTNNFVSAINECILQNGIQFNKSSNIVK